VRFKIAARITEFFALNLTSDPTELFWVTGSHFQGVRV